MLGAAARRLAGVVLVDARGADDGEPPQHVARGGAEPDHREAAHVAGLRARAPRVLALEAEHAVVLLGHALGDGVRKLQEPVVELAEVDEDERLYDPLVTLLSRGTVYNGPWENPSRSGEA